MNGVHEAGSSSLLTQTTRKCASYGALFLLKKRDLHEHIFSLLRAKDFLLSQQTVVVNIMQCFAKSFAWSGASHISTVFSYYTHRKTRSEQLRVFSMKRRKYGMKDEDARLMKMFVALTNCGDASLHFSLGHSPTSLLH